MSLYSNYINSLRVMNSMENGYVDFKSNPRYNMILEHVSEKIGYDYLQLIQSQFPNIFYGNLIEFIGLNDLYGNPKKYNYKITDEIYIDCSPTTLRYIYHALIILNHYKTTSSKSIVEVGCGYGGLFLAINYFSKIMDVTIDEYHIVDLNEACKLIEHYLSLHESQIQIKYFLHDSNLHGSDVLVNDLFLISNYCFTEIDEDNRRKYIDNLLYKTLNGFILWQSSFLPIEYVMKTIPYDITSLNEETPQTAPAHVSKNYHVCF